MASTGYGSFLSSTEFDDFKFDYKIFNLVLTETYNEHALKESILKIGKEICGAIAIQLAVVGYGNKNFGKIKFKDSDIDIADFFKKHNIKSDLSINAKLKPTDVTPRRLIRFFRFLIKDYVEKNEYCQTYLFKKYCLEKNNETRLFIFPGFEHLAEPSTDLHKVRKLLETYEYLDHRLNTHIKDRIVRVLIARGFNKEILNSSKYNELV